jgi:peptidoglycan LD-endopeptidase LytH
MLVLGSACLCFIFLAVILMNLEAPRGQARIDHELTGKGRAVLNPSPVSGSAASAISGSQPAAARAAAATPPVATSPLDGASPIEQADLVYLSAKDLLVPVAGVTANQLRDSFGDSRSEGRQHQALDIMAPKDAPVLATADGTVMKLFQSAKGGITLYQSDKSGLYVYYYAHLSRYADGITEGKQVRRGEVIAYVGDTGNAGPGNYHLHFSISKPTAPGKWSSGTPINPYPLLKKG